MFHTILTYVTVHKEALASLVGGAAGLSALAEVVLHKLHVKFSIDSKLFSFVLVQLLVLIASVSSWIVSNDNLAIVYPWLATSAAFAHRFLVSPLYTGKLLPWLEQRSATRAAFLTWLETQKPEATPASTPTATPADAQLV